MAITSLLPGKGRGRAPAPGKAPERGSLPFVGHALTMPSDGFLLYSMREARALGPIYTLRIFDQEMLIVSSLDLVAELCDESRFRKTVTDALEAVRDFAGDGLFTAYGEEPNWRRAHNILLPAFAANALRDYHPAMLKVARKLIAHWDRQAGRPVDVPGDMTRLTLDTIGLCGFGYDFDSFGRDTPHPFIGSMVRALAHAQAKPQFIPGLDFLYRSRNARNAADVAAMNGLVDEVVRRRRAAGPDRTDGADDLLGLMLHARDKDTGEPLDDVNIRHQVITFLIAGHETTSGALSFALYYLLKHPAVLARAQEETAALWGEDADPDPTYEDVGRLRYIRQVLNEGLRLWPTAPAFALEPLEDTVLGGRYPLRRGQSAVVLTPMLHRDPGWGDNPELFDPSRFDPERVAERDPHLFKPFGNGERSCIGRQFALHEATLLLGLLIHRYRLVDHSHYRLRIKETLTLKPDGFTLTPIRRTDADRARVRPPAASVAAPPEETAPALRAPGTALTVLYGSNLGACRSLAHDLADRAARHGFTPEVGRLDDAVDTLAPGRPVVIVTASYNGRPTDDAARFVSWLSDDAEDTRLAGVPYAVLGLGDRNWAATYQKIPALIDERLSAAGAEPVVERAAIDMGADGTDETARWGTGLWSALLDRYGEPTDGTEPEETAPRYTVEDTDDAPDADGLGMSPEGDELLPLEVLSNEDLCDTTSPLARSKRHIRLRLPAGADYRTGDHLLVRPANPAALVESTAALLGLDLDRVVRLRTTATGRDPLPVDRPLSVRALLTHFVELAQPVTARGAELLASVAPCPPDRIALEELAAAPRSATDEALPTVPLLLERYPSLQPSLALLLEALPPMRPRYYSISSSPATSPDTVDLMVAAAPAPHRSGKGTFLGAGPAYLSTVEPGDTVHARSAPCRDVFRLPEDPSVPVITVSAGTGLAPFRAAIAERAAEPRPDRAPLVCYFGCDHPDVDYLHRAELEKAEEAGAADLRPVFSRAPENGDRFVQHRIAREADRIWELLEAGAHVRVCGDGRAMAPAVREAFQRIHRDHAKDDARSAEDWLAALMDENRYVEDVWAG
ncbi:cytochrome P450 [Streptomyces sp. NPDC000927]|uniref:cytochrome P450 n=1 Tax=Streptomyces sp. NPDC000927 TaxID=3154371 RepID=UPI003318429A